MKSFKELLSHPLQGCLRGGGGEVIQGTVVSFIPGVSQRGAVVKSFKELLSHPFQGCLRGGGSEVIQGTVVSSIPVVSQRQGW